MRSEVAPSRAPPSASHLLFLLLSISRLLRERGKVRWERRVMEREQRRHTYVRAPPLPVAMDPENICGDRDPRALSDQLLLLSTEYSLQ
jgi:hypothetical protein